jgi:hypothetical protein
MAAQSAPGLAAAAAARALAAEERVRRALRDLDREGTPISFAAAAARAKVARSYLYRHAQLRGEVERLRAIQTAAPSRLPLRERASDASLQTRLRAALDDNRRQRDEIAQLRQELALAHGHARELELDRRISRSQQPAAPS